MVRSGLVARQIWPNSSDTGTRPTQTQTNTKPNTGLVSRSWPRTSASPTQTYSARTSNGDESDAADGRRSAAARAPAGRRPSRKRGRRQANNSTTNEIISATAAPATTNENGSGRSCREAMPCIGTSIAEAGGADDRTFKIAMIFSRWCDSTSKLPGLVTVTDPAWASPPRPPAVASPRVRVNLVVDVTGDLQDHRGPDGDVDLPAAGIDLAVRDRDVDRQCRRSAPACSASAGVGRPVGARRSAGGDRRRARPDWQAGPLVQPAASRPVPRRRAPRQSGRPPRHTSPAIIQRGAVSPSDHDSRSRSSSGLDRDPEVSTRPFVHHEGSSVERSRAVRIVAGRAVDR